MLVSPIGLLVSQPEPSLELVENLGRSGDANPITADLRRLDE
jgi:hypothetical protein